MPRLLDLYLAGRLPLDRLVSRSYPLDQVNPTPTATSQWARQP
jgi:Zn-dependent alcohol dehydrogenase